MGLNNMDAWKANTQAISDSLWDLEDLEEALVFVKCLCDKRVREVGRLG